MEGINIPRCNRIVGKPEKDCKIYIEDYVKSYIARLAQDTSEKGNIEILYGKYRTDGRRMEIDVGGAAALTHISRTGRQNKSLVKEIEVINMEFFPELEPVGWFYNREKTGKIDYAAMMDIHEELLGERNGIFVIPGESPDPDVFSYAEDGFRKHRGYIVYYEKNTEMQEYLLAHTKRIEENSRFRDVVTPLREKLNSENFKQRIIALPTMVKNFSKDVINRDTEGKSGHAEESAAGKSDEGSGRRKGMSLGAGFLITGLLAVVLAGMLIAFKTYYYVNFNDSIEYVKEFIRYSLGDGS